MSLLRGTVDGRTWLDWLISAVILAVALIFYNSIQLHHDVAWYAYCNLRQLEGMRPYVDVIEVSPPIVFYLTLPPVTVAAMTGTSVKFCIVAWVVSLSAVSLMMVSAIEDDSSIVERRVRMAFRAIILTLLPMAAFAQREHFAVILALPYLYAAGARLRGQHVPMTLATVAGLMAGVGLSIKHYFLLPSLLIELALLVARRSPRSLLRPELVGAVVAGVTYAAFVLLTHPEYFSVSVPLIFAAYGAYSLPMQMVATRPWSLATTLGILFWLLARKHIQKNQNADCLFVGTLGFYAAFFWQHKGWEYQALPVRLTLLMAGVEMFATAYFRRASSHGLSHRQSWLISVAPIAVVVAQILAWRPYRNRLALDAAPYIQRHAPRGSVFVMSSRISTAFPMVLDAGAKWASRFSAKWLLPAIIRSQRPVSASDAAHKSQLARLAAWEMEATITDFRRFRPEIVFVDCAIRDTATMLYKQPIDMIEYYQRDSRFREIWAEYALKDVLSSSLFGVPQRFEVWVRADL